MSLYHETAAILSSPTAEGGSLKSRIFGKKDLKSPPAQVYALALETCKWSIVLKEVIENAQILRGERKLTPVLALLLVHDHLLSKGGISLPQSHGLRAAVERHKVRLSSELTRARVRWKCSSLDALRAVVEAESRTGPVHPRWIRVNTLKTTVTEQLRTTFAGFESVSTVQPILDGAAKIVYLDCHIPNLIAISPGFDVIKTEAYKTGAIILQDKASCFPAYLLDPGIEDGDIIDACAAPGNKTTHLGDILDSMTTGGQTIHAFERDRNRAKTLARMVKIAGTDHFTRVHEGQDFMKVDPQAEAYRNVGALLLDPSCSGSGIVGRDEVPELHLPELPGSIGEGGKADADGNSRKRKRDGPNGRAPVVMIDDDGASTVLSSEKDLKARVEALASFQLSLLLHAFRFPAARKVTYSTCSMYAGENEHVVLKALGSDVARRRGWRVLPRERQVRGLREWPVRGSVEACNGRRDVAESCIRTYRDDGMGVMGFFVAAFERDDGCAGGHHCPFVRDESGQIVRDVRGIPTLKATGRKAIELDGEEENGDQRVIEYVSGDGDDDGDEPFLRDSGGRIVRDSEGMPALKPGARARIRGQELNGEHFTDGGDKAGEEVDEGEEEEGEEGEDDEDDEDSAEEDYAEDDEWTGFDN